MIVKLLFTLVTGIIGIIPFEIPSFPADVATYLETFKGYIFQGIGFVKFFLPWSYIVVLLKIVLGIIVALELYKFIMWILRKIPMLGMKE